MFILPAEVPSMRQLLNPTLEDRKSKKPTRLMDWTTMQSKFPWSVVLLLGGGFALASGVKETGLSNIIGNSLAGLNGFPTFVLQIICLFATMVVTNVCSNTVSASIFLPIVANLAQETGVNPLCLMLIGECLIYRLILLLYFSHNCLLFCLRSSRRHTFEHNLFCKWRLESFGHGKYGQ